MKKLVVEFGFLTRDTAKEPLFIASTRHLATIAPAYHWRPQCSRLRRAQSLGWLWSHCPSLNGHALTRRTRRRQWSQTRPALNLACNVISSGLAFVAIVAWATATSWRTLWSSSIRLVTGHFAFRRPVFVSGLLLLNSTEAREFEFLGLIFPFDAASLAIESDVHLFAIVRDSVI